MLGKRHSFIGMDLGARCIKVAQVSGARKQIRIEAAAVIPRQSTDAPLDQAGVQRIRDVLHRQGFRGNRLVVCAPADKLHVEQLDLPPRTSGAPIDQLARAEMMRMSRLEGNSFEMATWDLPAPPRGGTGTALMAVAASHADTEQLVHLFESEGLIIESLDVQACAIARACKPRIGQQGLAAVLDLGFHRAGLWFIRDGVIVFQRSFDHCGTSIVQAELVKRLSIDAEVADHLFLQLRADEKLPQAATVQAQIARYTEAIADELEASFAYINHRYNDSQPPVLYTIGGGAMSGAVRQQLSERLSIQIEALAPLSLAECARPLLEKCSTPLLTTALGLALYEGD